MLYKEIIVIVNNEKSRTECPIPSAIVPATLCAAPPMQ